MKSLVGRLSVAGDGMCTWCCKLLGRPAQDQCVGLTDLHMSMVVIGTYKKIWYS